MRAGHVASQTTGATRLNYTERVQRSLPLSLSLSFSVILWNCVIAAKTIAITRASRVEEISFSSETRVNAKRVSARSLSEFNSSRYLLQIIVISPPRS